MKTFEKGAEFREIFEPFGQGILTLDSHVWKRQRKVLQSLTKNNKKYAAYLQMLEGSLIPVLEHFLRLGTELDLKDKWFQLGEEKKLSKGLGIVDDFVARELNKFVYIHAALCKTLRLYPPVPVNNKSSIEADVLPSRDCVGPRTRILLSVYSMGRSEEIGGVQ
ncbi:hypothetical protein Gorai_004257 [Gossypium raimondii]|uniref:Cytochrome P450 n=1 Tax=Gossypium raimondii TaxID=29730 RepID=A0A7J8QHP1_GOSRA|nr:hypothetical protein [Gossypium raimondii]